jgi:hypothetical protein
VLTFDEELGSQDAVEKKEGVTAGGALVGGIREDSAETKHSTIHSRGKYGILTTTSAFRSTGMVERGNETNAPYGTNDLE